MKGGSSVFEPDFSGMSVHALPPETGKIEQNMHVIVLLVIKKR